MIEGAQYGFGNGATVTTSDSANLSPFARAVWVGGAGNVKVDTIGGQTITINSVAAGTLLPVQVRKIYATGTTATNMVALY